MLDLELLAPPTQTGLDVVSLAEMKKHIRLSPTITKMDDELTAAINAAVDVLHGPGGILNRTVLPCTWVRYLDRFPSCGYIQLPYPDLIEVQSVSYLNSDGDSPLSSLVFDEDYCVRTINMIPRVELQISRRWPTPYRKKRVVQVIYRAGYSTFPEKLKTWVRMYAAHLLQNKEMTINEPRQMMINRATEFGHLFLVNQLRVPNALDDWE